MILTKNVSMYVNYRYTDFYIKLGYKVKGGEIIIVPVEYLPKNSHSKIDVECDVCFTKKSISYQRYNDNIKKYDLYTCSTKCSLIKNKKTPTERSRHIEINIKSQ